MQNVTLGLIFQNPVTNVISQNKLQQFDMVSYDMETDSSIKIAIALQNITSLKEFSLARYNIGNIKLQMFLPIMQS